MVRLISEDTTRTPKGTIHHFTPIDGLDVAALNGTTIEVDGKRARVIDATENKLSTVRPTHFALILEFI